MSIRTANFTDIPRLVEIMTESHARSRDAEITTFDPVAAKQLLVRSIQRHGHMNYMGSMVLVAYRAVPNNVTGFVIGILDLVYPCLKELKVTDLLFLVGKHQNPGDSAKMVQALVRWGRENPKVIKVLLGVTDDAEDWRAVGNLYQAAGLEQCGGIYRVDFNRNELQQAEGA